MDVRLMAPRKKEPRRSRYGRALRSVSTWWASEKPEGFASVQKPRAGITKKRRTRRSVLWKPRAHKRVQEMSVTSFAGQTDDSDIKEARCSAVPTGRSKPVTRSKAGEQESESSSNWVGGNETSVQKKGRARKILADSGIARVVRKLVF